MNIEPEIISLSILDFYEQGQHLVYGKKYRCQSPQLAVHLWLAEQFAKDQVVVMSGNPPHPTFKDQEVIRWGLPGSLHSCLFNAQKQELPGFIPCFFLYTPELLASFFQTKVYKQIIAQGEAGQDVCVTYQDKCNVYLEGGFHIKPQKQKYTGFERVREHYDAIHSRQHGVAYDELFRLPLEVMNPYPKYFIEKIPQEYFN